MGRTESLLLHRVRGTFKGMVTLTLALVGAQSSALLSRACRKVGVCSKALLVGRHPVSGLQLGPVGPFKPQCLFQGGGRVLKCVGASRVL